MNEKKAKLDYNQVILAQIRQPLKLRLLLCSAIITGWYLLFFSPLSEETSATTARIVSERKRHHRRAAGSSSSRRQWCPTMGVYSAKPTSMSTCNT